MPQHKKKQAYDLGLILGLFIMIIGVLIGGGVVPIFQTVVSYTFPTSIIGTLPNGGSSNPTVIALNTTYTLSETVQCGSRVVSSASFTPSGGSAIALSYVGSSQVNSSVWRVFMQASYTFTKVIAGNSGTFSATCNGQTVNATVYYSVQASNVGSTTWSITYVNTAGQKVTQLVTPSSSINVGGPVLSFSGTIQYPQSAQQVSICLYSSSGSLIGSCIQIANPGATWNSSSIGTAGTFTLPSYGTYTVTGSILTTSNQNIVGMSLLDNFGTNTFSSPFTLGQYYNLVAGIITIILGGVLIGFTRYRKR